MEPSVFIAEELDSVNFALQVEHVVENVFAFLSVIDVQACCRVRRDWDKIGKKVLQRKSCVLFNFTRRQPGIDEAIAKMEKFRNFWQFHESPPPFFKIIFSGTIPLILLGPFLKKVGKYVRTLEFHGDIRFTLYVGKSEIDFTRNNSFDIANLVGPCMTSLSCLHINPSSFLPIILNLDRVFPFLQELSIDNCRIMLRESSKRLLLKKLDLGSQNKYFQNGVKQAEFVVTDFFDLSFTTCISLQGQNTILNFSDCRNKDITRNLYLEYIKVINWSKCDWKVKKLKLHGVPFLERNGMEIKELEAADTIIDFSKIHNPEKVEKFSCNANVEILQKPFLPNLKYLKIEAGESLHALSLFSKTKNLTKLVLSKKFSATASPLILNIQDLPKNIKVLQLSGSFATSIDDSAVYPLKKLIIEECNLKEFAPLEQLLAKFTAEFLAVEDNFYISNETKFSNVVNLVQNQHSYKQLIIGEFSFDGKINFPNSQISKFVDKEAKFYVFKGQIGRAIHWELFYKYINES